eukprot:m.207357 g.207357  ORF g.207357 m.207357 type:complete len:1660 (+) comp18519_c0_seq3:2501-7480(+)
MLSSLRDQLRTAEADLQAAQEDLRTAEAELASTRDALATTTSHNDRLTAQLADANSACAEVEGREQGLRDTVAELTAKVREVQAQADAAAQQARVAEGEVQGLARSRQDDQSADDAQATLLQAEGRARDAEKREHEAKQDAQQAREEARQADERAQDAEERALGAEERALGAEERARDAEERARRGEDEAGAAESLVQAADDRRMADIQELQARLESLTQTHAGELQAVREAVDQREAEVERLQRALQLEQQAGAGTADEDRRQLQQQLQQAHADARDLRQALDQARADANALQRDLDAAHADAEHQREHVAELSAQLAGARGLQQDLDAARADAESERERAADLARQLVDANERLAERADRSQPDSTNMADLVGDLREQMAEARAEARQLQEQHDAELQRLQAEHDEALEQALAERERLLSDEHRALESRFAELQQQLDDQQLDSDRRVHDEAARVAEVDALLQEQLAVEREELQRGWDELKRAREQLQQRKQQQDEAHARARDLLNQARAKEHELLTKEHELLAKEQSMMQHELDGQRLGRGPGAASNLSVTFASPRSAAHQTSLQREQALEQELQREELKLLAAKAELDAEQRALQLEIEQAGAGPLMNSSTAAPWGNASAISDAEGAFSGLRATLDRSRAAAEEDQRLLEALQAKPTVPVAQQLDTSASQSLLSLATPLTPLDNVTTSKLPALAATGATIEPTFSLTLSDDEGDEGHAGSTGRAADSEDSLDISLTDRLQAASQAHAAAEIGRMNAEALVRELKMMLEQEKLARAAAEEVKRDFEEKLQRMNDAMTAQQEQVMALERARLSSQAEAAGLRDAFDKVEVEYCTLLRRLQEAEAAVASQDDLIKAKDAGQEVAQQAEQDLTAANQTLQQQMSLMQASLKRMERERGNLQDANKDLALRLQEERTASLEATQQLQDRINKAREEIRSLQAENMAAAKKLQAANIVAEEHEAKAAAVMRTKKVVDEARAELEARCRVLDQKVHALEEQLRARPTPAPAQTVPPQQTHQLPSFAMPQGTATPAARTTSSPGDGEVIARLEQQIVKLRTDLSERTGELQVAQQDAQSRGHTLQTTQGELRDANHRLTDVSAQLDTERTRARVLESSVAKAQQELAELRDKLVRKDSAALQAQQQFSDLLDQEKRAHEAENAQLQARQKQLQTALSEAEARHATLETDGHDHRARLNSATGEKDDLARRCSELQREVEELKQALSVVNKQKSALQKDLDGVHSGFKSKTADHLALQRERDSLRDVVIELRAMCTGQQEKLQDNAAAIAELAESKQQLDALLVKAQGDLRVAKSELRQHQAQKMALEQGFDAAQSQKGTVQSMLAETKEENVRLADALRDVRAELQQAEAKAAEVKLLWETEVASRNQAGKHILGMEDRAQQLLKQVEREKQKQRDVKTRVADVLRRNEELQHDVGALTEALRVAQRKLADADDKDRRVLTLQKRVAELESEAAQKAGALRSVDEERRRLDEERRALDTRRILIQTERDTVAESAAARQRAERELALVRRGLLHTAAPRVRPHVQRPSADQQVELLLEQKALGSTGRDNFNREYRELAHKVDAAKSSVFAGPHSTRTDRRGGHMAPRRQPLSGLDNQGHLDRLDLGVKVAAASDQADAVLKASERTDRLLAKARADLQAPRLL